MVKMAIYTKKYEQKWLKTNNSGVCNKDVLGGKKSKINNRGGRRGGGRRFIRESRVYI